MQSSNVIRSVGSEPPARGSYLLNQYCETKLNPMVWLSKKRQTLSSSNGCVWLTYDHVI